MKKLKPILLIILVMTFFKIGFAHVTLLYPVGGEIFQAGEVVQIQWEIAIYHGPCDWDLFFSDDGGSTWQSIAADLPEAQLDYDWTAPNTATDSGQVKVVQDNATGMDYSDASGNFTINISTGIEESESHIESFALYPAYPNPFNPSTTIYYALSKGSRISLKIYNVVGERIKTLVDDFQSPGEKSVVWDGRNDLGQIVGSGVYIYQLKSGNQIRTKKLTFLK